MDITDVDNYFEEFAKRKAEKLHEFKENIFKEQKSRVYFDKRLWSATITHSKGGDYSVFQNK